MRIALITVGSRFSCMAKPLPGSNPGHRGNPAVL